MTTLSERSEAFAVEGRVALTRRGAARWRSGHPWIFRDDLESARSEDGSLVQVLSPGGEDLGTAFYGAVSRIALRRVTRAAQPVEPGLLEARLDAAIAYREIVASGAKALRIVSSDADGLPGLIVDRYADHLVVQALTVAIDRRLEAIADHLVARIAPASIVCRNDAGARRLEGLPLEARVLRGTLAGRVEYEEAGLRLSADLLSGQKTGAFLDQRENRIAAAQYLSGRLLDAFCHDGAFALHAARGARSVDMVDSSASALERAEANARANGFSHLRAVRANAFDYLASLARSQERYDGIVLDPPAFAKSRQDLAAAVRAYKEINLRAMKSLAPGGILVTCSCSYNMPEAAFLEVVAEAAADAKRRAIIVEKRIQARDHPVLLGLPESLYLKCLILRIE